MKWVCSLSTLSTPWNGGETFSMDTPEYADKASPQTHHQEAHAHYPYQPPSQDMTGSKRLTKWLTVKHPHLVDIPNLTMLEKRHPSISKEYREHIRPKSKKTDRLREFLTLHHPELLGTIRWKSDLPPDLLVEYTRYKGRVHDSNPTRSMKKKAWNEKNGDKTKTYAKTYRERHYEKETERSRTFLRGYRKTDKCKSYWKTHQKTIAYKWNLLKTSARQRGVALHLTKEDNERICTSKCHYCGDYPVDHNGIDRVDNNKGYIIGNVVPCCTFCNMAKRAYNIRTFIIGMCNIGSVELDNETFVRVYDDTQVNRTLSTYVSRAQTKGLEFTLTEQEFYAMTRKKCGYCHAPPSNGIDRVDNTIGYTPANTVPCCKTCNYIKKDTEISVFLQKAVKIFLRWAK